MKNKRVLKRIIDLPNEATLIYSYSCKITGNKNFSLNRDIIYIEHYSIDKEKKEYTVLVLSTNSPFKYTKTEQIFSDNTTLDLPWEILWSNED